MLKDLFIFLFREWMLIIIEMSFVVVFYGYLLEAMNSLEVHDKEVKEWDRKRDENTEK